MGTHKSKIKASYKHRDELERQVWLNPHLLSLFVNLADMDIFYLWRKCCDQKISEIVGKLTCGQCSYLYLS